MQPKGSKARRILIAISILAIAFLVPSKGLSTLAIPDDAYGGAAASIQDVPHAGKRGSDNAPLFVAAIMLVAVGIFVVIASRVRSAAARLSSIERPYHLIRGPPGGLATDRLYLIHQSI